MKKKKTKAEKEKWQDFWLHSWVLWRKNYFYSSERNLNFQQYSSLFLSFYSWFCCRTQSYHVSLMRQLRVLYSRYTHTSISPSRAHIATIYTSFKSVTILLSTITHGQRFTKYHLSFELWLPFTIFCKIAIHSPGMEPVFRIIYMHTPIGK